jgi:hypothetical protein
MSASEGRAVDVPISASVTNGEKIDESRRIKLRLNSNQGQIIEMRSLSASLDGKMFQNKIEPLQQKLPRVLSSIKSCCTVGWKGRISLRSFNLLSRADVPCTELLSQVEPYWNSPILPPFIGSADTVLRDIRDIPFVMNCISRNWRGDGEDNRSPPNTRNMRSASAFVESLHRSLRRKRIGDISEQVPHLLVLGVEANFLAEAKSCLDRRQGSIHSRR